MIKLIASDLDGTILLNGAQTLPEELFEIIRALKEMGIFFVAASGRQYTNMKRNFEPVARDIGFVCENGAIAYWKDQLLYEISFDREVADALTRDIIRREGSEFLYSTRDFYYIMPKTEEYVHHLRDVVKNDFQIVENLEDMKLPCVKMACYVSGGATEAVCEEWRRLYSDRCKVVTAGPVWVDFVSHEANKAVGVRKFMELLQVRPEECMVFGDEFNDVDMLRCVPYGFAMAHAKEGVKKQASYIADNVVEILKCLLKADGDIQKVLKECVPNTGCAVNPVI